MLFNCLLIVSTAYCKLHFRFKTTDIPVFVLFSIAQSTLDVLFQYPQSCTISKQIKWVKGKYFSKLHSTHKSLSLFK